MVEIFAHIAALTVFASYFAICGYIGYHLYKLGSSKKRAAVVALLSIPFTPIWAGVYVIAKYKLRKYSARSETVKKSGDALAGFWQKRRYRYPIVAVLAFTAFGMLAEYVENQMLDEFNEKRETIIAEMQTDLKRENYDTAIETAERYVSFVKDAELEKLYEEALIGKIAAMQGDDLEILRDKQDIYEDLVRFNKHYANEHSEIGNQIQKIEAEIQTAEAARKQRRKEPENARYQCKQAVKAQSKFPSKVDFVSGTTHDQSLPVTVDGVVNLMNGFGAMIPHRYYCRFDGERLAEVTITPGG